MAFMASLKTGTILSNKIPLTDLPQYKWTWTDITIVTSNHPQTLFPILLSHSAPPYCFWHHQGLWYREQDAY